MRTWSAVLLGALLLAPLSPSGVAWSADWDFEPGSLGADALLSKRRPPGRLQGKPRLAASPNRLELDGKSWVELSDDVQAYGLPIEALTVETWVRVDKAGKWCGFVSAIQDNGSYERGWMLGFQDGRFCFGLASDQRKSMTYLPASEAIALGAWYHVAGVWDGKTMRLYVDGRLAAQSPAQSGGVRYAPKGVVALGAYVDDNERYPLTGALARTSIHDKALAPETLARMFASGKKAFPGAEPTEAAATVTGWPTYMHDAKRSGVTSESLSRTLRLRWAYRARRQPSPAWPPPAKQDFWHKKTDLRPRVAFDRAFHVVSDGERVYFGSSADDQVRALDLKSGQTRWSSFADGPIRLAPTVADGKVYFGSDDGRVYCVDAKTGREQWRFEAASSPRVIPGNGRLISIFPVRTGVVVQNGAARFGSGLFPAQGAHQFAVDASTGKLLAQGKLSFSPQGYMQQVGSSFRVAQGRAPQQTLAASNTKKAIPKKGAVIGSVRKPRDGYPHAWIRAADLHIGAGDDQIAMFADDVAEPVWQAPVKGRAYSLAVAGGCLLASTDAGWIYCFVPESGDPSTIDQRAAAAEPASNRVDVALSRRVERIAEHIEGAAGYGLLVEADVSLAAEFARKTPFQYVLVLADKQKAERARRILNEAGVYGRVTVRSASATPPFATKLFNVVVLAGDSGWKDSAVAKLVRPAGGLLVDLRTPQTRAKSLTGGPWERMSGDNISGNALAMWRRLPLPGAGSWTHMYGDAANSACSQDALVRGKLNLQWFGEPGPREMMDRHHRATPPLCIDGRLFVPGNETVYGVDAYNGAVLWRVELPNFRRVGAPRDSGNMAASSDTLYALAKDRCYAFGAGDGSQHATFAPPAQADAKPRDWGYLAVHGEGLIGSTTQPGASRADHNREQINETYYDFVPIVTSDSLFRLHRKTGAKGWTYAPRGAILNPTITLGGGRLYFVESRDASTLRTSPEQKGRIRLADFFRQGADLIALDAETGKLAWRTAVAFEKIEHHLYLAYAKEKLVAVGTRNEGDKRKTVRYDLAVLDASNGKPVWTATQDQRQASGGSHGEQDHHPAIVGDQILQEPYAYNLHTGERRKDWRFQRGGHGCGTVSASASAFFYRAGNPTMCDIATGERRKVNAVSRPGCWINIIPAAGMLLIPEASSGCTCNFPIQSSMAFAPEESDQE